MSLAIIKFHYKQIHCQIISNLQLTLTAATRTKNQHIAQVDFLQFSINFSPVICTFGYPHIIGYTFFL